MVDTNERSSPARQQSKTERQRQRVTLEELENGNGSDKGGKSVPCGTDCARRDENLKWTTKSGRLSAMPRSLSQNARYSKNATAGNKGPAPGAFAVGYGNEECTESAPLPPAQESIVAKVVEECPVYAAEAQVVQDDNNDDDDKKKSKKQRMIVLFLVALIVLLVVLVAVLIPRARRGNGHYMMATQHPNVPEPSPSPSLDFPTAVPTQNSQAPPQAPANGTSASLPDSLGVFAELQGFPWELIGNSGISGQSSDIRFGATVSLNGDGSIVAIGAPLDGPNGEGSIYVFEKAKRWRALGDPIVGEFVGGNLGSSLSISRDGLSLVAGAPGAMDDLGVAQVYTFDGIFWEQTGQTLAGSGGGGMNGDAVAMSANGNFIAVAASLGLGDVGDPTTAGAGRVQVYMYNIARGLWVQKGQDLVGEKGFDNFGSAVALTRNGRRLAVGAPNAGLESEGEVCVYELDAVENEWISLGGKVKGIDNGTNLGNSVAFSLEGERLIAGGEQFANGRGLARVYGFGGISWSQVGQDLIGVSEGDHVGWSVSINDDGSLVAVGMNPTEASEEGSRKTKGALVLRDSGERWERTSQVFGTGEPGSYDVALATSQHTVAVGVPSGVVRVFGV